MSINWAPVQTWPRRPRGTDAGRTTSPARSARTSRVPRLGLAVVACMDTRLDMRRLRLRPGDAHIIRNAGAFVSSDVLRSLAISQSELKTRRILLVAHTDCGALGIDQSEYSAAQARRVGTSPPWDVDRARTPEEALRRGARTIESCPFLLHTSLRTAIYDVETQAVSFMGR